MIALLLYINATVRIYEYLYVTSDGSAVGYEFCLN
jgi:hypothetical protein